RVGPRRKGYELGSPRTIRISRRRIIDGDTEVPQVSCSFGCGRHTSQYGAADAPPCSLVVTEHEQLVLAKGSSQGSPKLIPVEGRHTFGLRKGIAGLEIIEPVVFEGCAVDLVRSRFCLDLNNGSAGLGEFRVKVTARGVYFLYRIHRRIHGDDSKDWIRIIHAVDHKVGAAEQLAVIVDLYAVLWILPFGVLPGHFRSARQEQLQLCEVAIDQGE